MVLAVASRLSMKRRLIPFLIWRNGAPSGVTPTVEHRDHAGDAIDLGGIGLDAHVRQCFLERAGPREQLTNFGRPDFELVHGSIVIYHELPESTPRRGAGQNITLFLLLESMLTA